VSTTGGASPQVGAAGLEAGPTQYFPCFDAFRFIGMTMVLLLHASFATRPWVEAHLPHWMASVFDRMDVGVAVFFVISGFLLFRPVMVRLLTGERQVRATTFFRRRWVRIFPGYWFALTVCVVFLGQLLGSVKNAVWYYSLLYPFASSNVALAGPPGHEGTYAIPQAWTLTAEIGLYLVLPVIALVLVRTVANRPREVQVKWALVACALLYAIAQLYRVYLVVVQPSWLRQGVLWTPNWADFFAIGMATAAFSAAHAQGRRLPSLLRSLGDHPVVSWCIAVLVGASFAFFSPPAAPGAIGAEYVLRRFLFGVFAFFLLAPAMFGDQTKGRARRVLASRPLVLLGTVSLGFYLFQLAVMSNVQDWLAPAGTSSAFYGSFPEVFALTFVGAIALAALSYYLVERPCLRLKDRPLSGWWRRPSTGVGP
jgi:peptidoglycan/LPS O-acetylase OafA/YrhL